MARWNDTSAYANLPSPDPADLMPIADASATATEQQRTITWAQVAAAGLAVVSTNAPTVDDDETLGYQVGWKWFDSTTDRLYVLEDASDGAAVWTPLVPVPAGGTTGQVLAKASDTDFDLAWVTP